MRLTRLEKFDVSCVSLWNRAPLKRAMSGILWEVNVAEMKNIPGVIDACRKNRVVNEVKVKSILFF